MSRTQEQNPAFAFIQAAQELSSADYVCLEARTPEICVNGKIGDVLLSGIGTVDDDLEGQKDDLQALMQLADEHGVTLIVWCSDDFDEWMPDDTDLSEEQQVEWFANQGFTEKSENGLLTVMKRPPQPLEPAFSSAI